MMKHLLFIHLLKLYIVSWPDAVFLCWFIVDDNRHKLTELFSNLTIQWDRFETSKLFFKYLWNISKKKI